MQQNDQGRVLRTLVQTRGLCCYACSIRAKPLRRLVLKKLVLKLIFAFLVLPAAIVATVFHLNKNGFFDITEAEVILEDAPVGQEQFLNPLVAKLEQELKRYNGMSLWDIKLKGVSKQLDSLEWISQSSVKRSWPTSLTVRVRPHEVKLLFLSKGGKLIPIIEDGSLLEAVDSKQAPDVALLDGENFLKQSELRKRAVKIMAEIPNTGSFSKQTISEIRYDQKEGFWMSLVRSGLQVKMGEDQMALKAARVSQVVEYLENHQFDARVIDANLSKKVLVRLRKDP